MQDSGEDRMSFGSAVALSSDASVLVVGASSLSPSPGFVYVYTCDGAGAW